MSTKVSFILILLCARPPISSIPEHCLTMDADDSNDWRLSVTVGLREHLVKKLLRAITLTNELNDFTLVVPYYTDDKVKAIESQCFEVANSRMEYYTLVAAKIYAIQRFIDENEEQIRMGEENTSNCGAEGEITRVNLSLSDPFGKKMDNFLTMLVEWRSSVTDDVRDHLVKKILKAITLTNESNDLNTVLPDHIVSKVKAMENQFFLEANSRFQYYHMVAAKIYDIQKFIDDHQEQMRMVLDSASHTASESEMVDLENMFKDVLQLK